MMKWKSVLLSVILLLLGTAGAALAHGVQVEYTISTMVEIQASYDTGEPMAGGQVTVYAPSDLAAPWLTGICDDEGRFTFAPDPSSPGTYDVQVRQAGHGDIVHIPIAEGAAISSGGSFTMPQILLMAASVGWGFVGTALFFSRRHTTPPEESEA